MDLLNFIYTILGIAASAIAITTAIWGGLKLAKAFHRRVREGKKSILYVPDSIKIQNKSRKKMYGRTIWIIFSLISLSFFISFLPFGSIFSQIGGIIFHYGGQGFISSVPTDCPPTGVARPATMKPLSVGNDQSIIYLINQGSQSKSPTSILKRYNTVTGSKTEIAKFANTLITQAEVSKNGQWLLFVAQTSGLFKLQLIRVDGRYLQTIYCGSTAESIDRPLWSSDQKWVMFGDNGSIYLLDISSGVLQSELTGSCGSYFSPIAWINKTQAYVDHGNTCMCAGCSAVELLDINSGTNLVWQDLKFIAGTSFTMSLDISPDGKQLFIAGSSSFASNQSESDITVQPATGGQENTINSSPLPNIDQIRVISPSTLLLVTSDNADTSRNGLWKMKTDGSGLTKLIVNNSYMHLNDFTHDSWANASRDDRLYSIFTENQKGLSVLLFGQISGGTSTAFESAPVGNDLAIVGWTTE